MEPFRLIQISWVFKLCHESLEGKDFEMIFVCLFFHVSNSDWKFYKSVPHCGILSLVLYVLTCKKK